MKQIIVTINPHKGGRLCGECERQFHAGYLVCPWSLARGFANNRRGRTCLDADAKLTALVEAAEFMLHDDPLKRDKVALRKALAVIKGAS